MSTFYKSRKYHPKLRVTKQADGTYKRMVFAGNVGGRDLFTAVSVHMTAGEAIKNVNKIEGN